MNQVETILQKQAATKFRLELVSIHSGSCHWQLSGRKAWRTLSFAHALSLQQYGESNCQCHPGFQQIPVEKKHVASPGVRDETLHSYKWNLAPGAMIHKGAARDRRVKNMYVKKCISTVLHIIYYAL